MKILHTSDIQLDAPFRFLGEKGQAHRDQLRATFANIVDLAINDGFDLLIIAGDLFDSNRPSQSTVDFVTAQLRRAFIPVCILPGNHDCYEQGSIYKKTEFPNNVTVFTDEVGEKAFPELDISVYGKAIRRRDTRESPLSGVKPSGDTRWNVATAHGNVDFGRIDDPVRPISREEIAGCGMDYVAMGDWHGFSDYSEGNVKAFYCGAPEPTSFDHQNAGYVASISLDESGVIVDRVRIGKIIANKDVLDISGLNESEIIDAIQQHANPILMFEVNLTGLLDVDTIIDPEQLVNALSSNFYALRIIDQTHPQLEDISLDDYLSNNVIRKYIELMIGRIDEAPDEESRRRAERALQVGVALLEGKEVV